MQKYYNLIKEHSFITLRNLQYFILRLASLITLPNILINFKNFIYILRYDI
jgi:hypothetical protein